MMKVVDVRLGRRRISVCQETTTRVTRRLYIIITRSSPLNGVHPHSYVVRACLRQVVEVGGKEEELAVPACAPNRLVPNESGVLDPVYPSTPPPRGIFHVRADFYTTSTGLYSMSPTLQPSLHIFYVSLHLITTPK
jgi:hypothetical protein